eukprot:13026979-Ditylum_brightwellii.AAC.2
MEDAINELYNELNAARNDKDEWHSHLKSATKNDVTEVSYQILKKDEPVAVAKYIKEYVVEKSRRNGFSNSWASKRLHHIKGIDRSFRIKIICRTGRQRELMKGQEIDNHSEHQGIKKKMFRNPRNQKQHVKEKFGIEIPKNTCEALLIDCANGDNKWGKAIATEMNSLERFNVFEYHNPGTMFS